MDNKPGIVPDSKQFIFSRYLPKTGQMTVYQAGDDGDYRAGWSIGDRFIEKNIGGEDLILDRATGLIWPKDGLSAGGNNGNLINWSNAIIYAEALTFAGFTDWRLPNIAEILSIIDHSKMPGPFHIFYSVFTNPEPRDHWSSTTLRVATTNAWHLAGAGNKQVQPKTNSCYMRVVRKGSV